MVGNGKIFLFGAFVVLQLFASASVKDKIIYWMDLWCDAVLTSLCSRKQTT